MVMWSKKIEVKTPLGTVRGSKIDTAHGFPIYTFQGIPYAKPPIGDLRFKNPVPIEPWTKVLDATKPGNCSPCINVEDLKFNLKPGSSEDCLYLNVYTPQMPPVPEPLPVLVYIHGGGYTIGSGSRDACGPDYLVPNGVILVTFNFRLGIFGFLSFKNKECPGNFGLKDQALVLRWVQNNISAFGGNPNNVTLSGHDTGAVSVQYHMLSPLSRGLFHRAIAQSGSIFCRTSYARHPIETGLLLAKKLGCDTKDPSTAFNAIRRSPMSRILEFCDGLESEIYGFWASENIFFQSYVPIAEPEDVADAFITKTPEQALADGDCMDIPIMQGINSNQMNFAMLSANYIPLFSKDEDYQYMLPKEFEIPLHSEKLVASAAKLRKFYFPNGNTQQGYLRAQNALWFTYPLYRLTRVLLNDKSRKSPCYLNIFDETRFPSAFRHVLRMHEVPGSSHGDDAEFLFHPGFLKYGKKCVDPSTKEGKIQALYTKLWTDFAKTGVPSPDWPVTDTKSWQYVEIKDTLLVKSKFFHDEVQFWDDLYNFMKP